MVGTGLGAAAIAARQSIVRLCASQLPPLELLEQVAHRVRSVVPYTTGGSTTVDPATLLCTGMFVEGAPQQMLRDLIDNEHTEADFAKFNQVARLRRPVLRLSEATDGALARSARHRKIYAPGGYGPELRAMFRTRGVCWGRGLWLRSEGDPDFADAEVEFIASVAEHVAHGLRTGLLIRSIRDDVALPEPPGMVVLRDDDTVESLTVEAERWLDDFPPEGLELPSIVYQVARHASMLADTGGSGPPARARVRLRSGRWLLVHGARLRTADGGPVRTAVMLEPVSRAELAPLIVEMYELTDRERQITQLLVSGKPIDEIARTLSISQHTVRDHVKAIFGKFGVTSRPELTAMLFHEHYLPAVWNGAMKVTAMPPVPLHECSESRPGARRS